MGTKENISAIQMHFDVSPGDIVTCPECNEESPEEDWQETEVGCEDCGSHPAIRCPKCGEAFDAVKQLEIFEGKIKRKEESIS